MRSDQAGKAAKSANDDQEFEMKLRRLTLALAAALAASALSTAICAAPALPDGMGGYYNDDGHYASDGMGGYFTPDGDRMMSDGGGGYYTKDGHINSNDYDYDFY